MRYITLTILVVLLAGCSKHKTTIQEHELAGDYEWYYSYPDHVNSTSYEQIEDRYGIRIKASGKIFFFKNGVEEDKFKVSSISSPEGTLIEGILINYKIDKFKSGYLNWDGENLIHFEWPFEGNTNKFLKL